MCYLLSLKREKLALLQIVCFLVFTKEEEEALRMQNDFSRVLAKLDTVQDKMFSVSNFLYQTQEGRGVL